MSNNDSKDFDRREAALDAVPCTTPMPQPIPDALPPAVEVPCGVPEPLVPLFVAPPLPPAAQPPSRRLPVGLRIGNSEQSFSCPDGQAPQNPDLTESVVIEAGKHDVLLFLDTITIGGTQSIGRDDLYRIAPLMPLLQSYADTSLRDDSATLADVASFVVAALEVSNAVGIAIATEMLELQATVDTMAYTEGTSALSCVWWNDPLWLRCNPVAGYDVLTEFAEDADVMVEGYLTFSSVSKEEANALAARRYAPNLPCVYPNDPVTISCLQLDTIYDVTVQLTPTTAAPLSTLHDVVFDTYDTVVAGLPGRRLVFTVTIPAGSFHAQDVASATAIARSEALSRLDCFFPSTSLETDCTDEEGSVAVYNAAVIVRQAAKTYTDAEMLNELATGYPDVSRDTPGTPGYMPDNVGILDGDLDTRISVRVTLPTGFFVNTQSPETANSLARSHAASFVVCQWVSPQHYCKCYGTPSDSPLADSAPYLHKVESGVEMFGVNAQPNLPYGNDATELDQNGAPVLDTEGQPKSTWTNVAYVHSDNNDDNLIAAGTYTDTNIPTEDPEGDPGGDLWTDLSDICRSSLTCKFSACTVIFCEPFPDNRTAMLNGEANWVSWGGVQNRVAASGEIVMQLNTELLTMVGACSATGWMAPCAMDPNDRSGLVLYSAPGLTYNSTELADSITGGWYTKASNAAGAPPLGTPAVFINGGILEEGGSWSDNCDETGTPITSSIPNLYSGACGCHTDTNPSSLWTVVMLAKTDAASRLDCQHTAWDRSISRCVSPSHVAGKTDVIYDEIPRAATTEISNAIVEAGILAEMDCQEKTGGTIGVSIDSVQVGGFSVDNVGEDECPPTGIEEVDLMVASGDGYASLTQTSDILTNLGDNEARDFFIASVCSESGASGGKLIFVLEKRDGDVDELWEATQGGPHVTKMPTTVASNLEDVEGDKVWYIGSVVRRRPGAGEKPVTRVLQYHNGPLIIRKSCCDSSSDSSDSDSSDSSDSSRSESSDSGSGSDGSGSPGSGGSPGSTPSDSGSDKSTAIIPMPTSPTGYKAMFTMESNKVLFEFMMVDIELTGSVTSVPIAMDHLLACESGTLRVCGAPCGNRPFPVGAEVRNRTVIIRAWPISFLRPRRVSLKITGIRRGFLNHDMPTRTRAQFIANEAFINSAYPPDPPRPNNCNEFW